MEQNKEMNAFTTNYVNQIQHQLIEKRDQTNSFILYHKDQINTISTKFTEKLSNQIFSTMNRMANITETQIKLLQEETSSYLHNFLEVYSLIQQSLLHSFTNLENYLSSGDMNSNSYNPSPYIKKALFKEELLSGSFDFSKYDLAYDNKLLNEGIKEIIASSLQQNNIILTISNSEDKEKDISMINDSAAKISELKFEEIEGAHDYFNNKTVVFSKMKALEFKKCNFNSISFQNENVVESERFPLLTKVTFNQSFPTEDNHLNASSLPPFTITSRLPSIQILKFENSNLVNSELESIFQKIILKSHLIQTLKVLSFADNSLRSFNLKEIIDNEEAQVQFNQLEEIDFSNNKMFLFKFGYGFFPKIRFINLIDNQITNKIEVEYPPKRASTLLLCNRNLLLTNQDTLTEYYELTKGVLADFDYKLEFMSLSGLFTKFTAERLIDLSLSPAILLNMKLLDLSYCGLNTNVVIRFLVKHNKMLTLKQLDLKYNFITLDFFEEYNKAFDDVKEKKLIYLEKIDLSNNSIENKNFKPLLEFIDAHNNFTHLNLQMNPFGREYSAEKKSNRLKANGGNGNVIDTNKKGEPFYAVNMSKEPSGDYFTLCDLLVKLYDPEKKIVNKTFYLDLSTESKMIKAHRLEKKLLTLTIKPKIIK